MKIYSFNILVAGLQQEVDIIATNEYEAKSILQSISDAEIINE